MKHSRTAYHRRRRDLLGRVKRKSISDSESIEKLAAAVLLFCLCLSDLLTLLMKDLELERDYKIPPWLTITAPRSIDRRISTSGPSQP